MPRTRKPVLGRYSLEYDVERRFLRVNGTVKKYRQWRKRRMRMQRESRRRNRV